jgi:LysR family transcriptional regulator, nitrogen assimilation regulatory protein
MDLTSIRYFVHCAEVKSLTAAAKDLAVAQPALTRRIHRLEEECRAQLFERQARGVSLTPEGQKFLEHCRRILREVSLANEAVARGGAAAERVFSLGVPGTCAATLVPELIEGLRHLFPRIHLDVTEGTTPALIEELIAGRVDLAVLQNPPPLDRLMITPHLVEPLVVVMAAEQAPRGDSMTLAELARLPLALTKGILKLVNEQIPAPDRQLRVNYTISSPQAIRALLLRGLGATIVPVSTFRHDVASGRVTALTLADVPLRRTLATAHLAKPNFADLEGAISAVRATLDALARDGYFTLSAGAGAARVAPAPRRRQAGELVEAD